MAEGQPEEKLLDEIADDQLETQRVLMLLVHEIRGGRRQLRYLAVVVTIGVLATLFVIAILLAGFTITTSTG